VNGFGFVQLRKLLYNSPVRIIGSHLDITHDKYNEQQLELSALEAKKANKAKSEFLSSMSHELRTPLNAILGFSQLLENDRKSPLTHVQKEKIGYINSSGNHLLSLINEVLELSAIEAGKMSLSIEAINLKEAIDESILLVQGLAEQNQITINRLETELSVLVVADYIRLKQVLLNLLSNAIKYNRQGGSVTVEWEISRDNIIKIKVIDTGIGISLKKQDKVVSTLNLRVKIKFLK